MCWGSSSLEDTLPVPTPPQLEYQRHEISALIHFNMATFAENGDPGCNAKNWNKLAPPATGPTSDPVTFNPVKLNISNWAESMLALGAKHAVLTAKHGCGYLLWPTKTRLPDGSEFTYCVGKERSAIKRDVIREFSDTMRQHGIGYGYYYSLGSNFHFDVKGMKVQNSSLLPGQVRLTQEQFEAISLAQVAELWSNYGPLTEIWFDGGYQSSLKGRLVEMLRRMQPNATGFGGQGITPNSVCWVGTESGLPGGEIWSTGADQQGDPSSSVFCPKGCDTTLQKSDIWFWTGIDIRPLRELIDVYHSTVGRNGVLELDFAIDREGLVDPAHAKRYAELGVWIRACYGQPVVEASANGTYAELLLPNGAPPIDRVVLQEDLQRGQRVRAYEVDVEEQGQWKPFASGSSIGNKRIDLGPPTTAASRRFRLNITSFVGSGGPFITRFAAYRACSTGPDEVYV